MNPFALIKLLMTLAPAVRQIVAELVSEINKDDDPEQAAKQALAAYRIVRKFSNVQRKKREG